MLYIEPTPHRETCWSAEYEPTRFEPSCVADFRFSDAERTCRHRDCDDDSEYGIVDDLDEPTDPGEIFCQGHAFSEVVRRINAGDRAFAMVLLPAGVE